MKDYYKILEVNKSASSEIISKVYKILAKKYHPDMNKDDIEDAEEKFKEISEAYEVLSNEEKRKTYDEELEEYEKQLKEEKVTSNYVPLGVFLKLQEYCKDLENSILNFTNTTNNFVSNANPVIAQDNDYENMSIAELETKIEELEKEEKKEKKVKRMELLKNVIATIIMLLFILWLFKQNNGITNIK